MPARIALILSCLLLGAAVAAVPVPEMVTAALYGGSPARNLANTTEKNIPGDWSIDRKAPKLVKWKAQLGGFAYGGPLVAEGKVFIGTSNGKPRDPKIVGDKGVLMCFDAKTGAFLWQNAHAKRGDQIDAPQVGIVSTPAVEKNRIYYVSNRCEVVCADTTTGGILWSLDMVEQLGVYPGGLSGSTATCSPLLVDDLVIVNTGNGVEMQTEKPKNPKAPSLIAVDKTTGKLVWQDASPGNDILDGQWSSPAAARIDGQWQVIHGFGDGWVRGFEAKTGKLLWKFDGNPKGLAFNPNRKNSKNYFLAMPVVYEEKVHIATGMEPESGNGVGHLWCIDPKKKPTNKELDLSPVDNDYDPKSPRNKDSGLVWHHGGAIVPLPAGSDRSAHFYRSMATLAIHAGIVYAVEIPGYLQALDARTGKKLWEADLKDSTWSSPYYVDGKVFIGVDNGDLFVFAAGDRLKELAVINMEQAVRSPVTVAGGVLYVSNGLHLYAIGK